MRIKSVLAIGMAVILILACAWLPDIVGDHMDRRNEDQVLFAAVEGVRLEFAKNGLTTRQILSLLAPSRSTVDVPVELASRSQEEILEIAAAATQRYEQTGVLMESMTGSQLLYSYAFLAYGLENQSNLFWVVGYGDPKGSSMFHLVIDDRTGLVCSVEYMVNSGIYEGRQEMEYVLSQFCQQYLTGLGEEFMDYRAADVVQSALFPTDGMYLAGELLWEDPLYGTNTIAFFVNSNGFYTHFLGAPR